MFACERDDANASNARVEKRASRTLSRKIWQRKNFRGKLRKRADRSPRASRDAESCRPDSHV